VPDCIGFIGMQPPNMHLNLLLKCWFESLQPWVTNRVCHAQALCPRVPLAAFYFAASTFLIQLPPVMSSSADSLWLQAAVI